MNMQVSAETLSQFLIACGGRCRWPYGPQRAVDPSPRCRGLWTLPVEESLGDRVLVTWTSIPCFRAFDEAPDSVNHRAVIQSQRHGRSGSGNRSSESSLQFHQVFPQATQMHPLEDPSAFQRKSLKCSFPQATFHPRYPVPAEGLKTLLCSLPAESVRRSW